MADTIINLKAKEKVFVTEEGAKIPSNNWKVGQEITVHPVMAEYFLKHGVVSKTAPTSKPKKEKE